MYINPNKINDIMKNCLLQLINNKKIIYNLIESVNTSLNFFFIKEVSVNTTKNSNVKYDMKCFRYTLCVSNS